MTKQYKNSVLSKPHSALWGVGIRSKPPECAARSEHAPRLQNAALRAVYAAQLGIFQTSHAGSGLVIPTHRNQDGSFHTCSVLGMISCPHPSFLQSWSTGNP